MRLDPQRLVFIDETSTTPKMTRPGGRERYERLRVAAPLGHWGRQTFIAGLRCDGLIAPWVLNGSIDRAAFDTHVETQPAPELAPGDVVILDNLSSHESPRAARALKARGAWFLFLPPYSPESNPIGMASPKLKAHLCRVVRSICSLYDECECQNYFIATEDAHE
jgi:hypothetical protein